MVRGRGRSWGRLAAMLLLMMAPAPAGGEIVSFIEPVNGSTFHDGQNVSVVFFASAACKTALYLDGDLILSAEMREGEQSSVFLHHVQRGTKVLSVRTIMPGSSGTTFESSEVIFTVSPDPSGQERAWPNLVTDEREGLMLCQDPIAAASRENGG
eukprot:353811-Hanusia_phi.AAC.1